jgi:nicotinamide-nucleotide adenylyltransferase
MPSRRESEGMGVEPSSHSLWGIAELETMSFITAIERVQQRLASVVLIFKSHERWPLPSDPSKSKNNLQINVLDSSFNPPTLAHRALISAPNPFSPTPNYDAHLLLLSIRNADKSLVPGDATLDQRLEMMTILAQDIQSHDKTAPLNVAVAIIDQPTFVGKSSSLLRFLHSHLSSITPNPVHGINFQLAFLIGFDTLERILSPRYYSSEPEMNRSLRAFLSDDGDNSRLVCARRPGLTLVGSESERSTLTVAKEFIEHQQLALIDIADTVNIFSSSHIRHQIKTGDWTWKDATTQAIVQYILSHNLYYPVES